VLGFVLGTVNKNLAEQAATNPAMANQPAMSGAMSGPPHVFGELSGIYRRPRRVDVLD